MNPRRLFAIAFKETLQVWRDPRSLAIALLMPLMQMALLGYGVSLDIRRVPLCVYDQENSQTSRELVQRFVASKWFVVARVLSDERAVRDAMDRGTCIGAVTIPVNFSRILTTTGAASVQTVFDATDANTTTIAIGYAQGVIAQTTADFQARWAAAHGLRPQTVGGVDLEPRVWFNEGLDSRNFIIPGVVAVILGLVGAQLTSLTISREWERGTMEQLVSTPVTALEVMIGKLVPYFVIGLFDAAFCLCATAFWFRCRSAAASAR
jgi:ABC-2 type transport system permease protein